MSDPAGDAYQYLERESANLFREIALALRYQDYADLIPVERFRQLSFIAICDLFSDKDDGEIGDIIDLKPEEVVFLRQEPQYAEIRHEAKEEMARLREPKSLQEHVNDKKVQDRLARSQIRMALHSKDHRVRIKAAEAMHDRAMPKVIRQEGAKVLMIRAEDLALLQETQQQLLIEGEVEEIVDGEPGEDEPAGAPEVEEAG